MDNSTLLADAVQHASAIIPANDYSRGNAALYLIQNGDAWSPYDQSGNVMALARGALGEHHALPYFIYLSRVKQGAAPRTGIMAQATMLDALRNTMCVVSEGHGIFYNYVTKPERSTQIGDRCGADSAIGRAFAALGLQPAARVSLRLG